MAQVIINIPDNQITDYLNAFEWKFDYNNNRLNGESKANFGKRKIAEYAKSILIEYKIKLFLDSRLSQLESDKQAELDLLNQINIS